VPAIVLFPSAHCQPIRQADHFLPFVPSWKDSQALSDKTKQGHAQVADQKFWGRFAQDKWLTAPETTMLIASWAPKLAAMRAKSQTDRGNQYEQLGRSPGRLLLRFDRNIEDKYKN